MKFKYFDIETKIHRIGGKENRDIQISEFKLAVMRDEKL